MEQETKAKSEGGQVKKTIYGQDGQVKRTIYGQGNQPYPDQGQPRRVVRQPQNQGGQAGGTVYGQGNQPYPGQDQSRRAVRQPRSQEGQAPRQRIAGQPQGQGVPQGQPRRGASEQQDPRLRQNPRQPRSAAGQPYAQGGQMPPQGQRAPRGQAPGVVYDRNGRPQQGRVPYGQGGRVPAGGQMGDPYRPQGTMVQRRTGHTPDPRSGMSGRWLMERSKKMFHSPVFFIIALMCTVFTVTTIASVLLQDLSFSQVINILANFDAPSELMEYANRILSFISNIGSGVILVSLLLHLPELLLCAGFWILFATSGRGRESMPGAGFLCTKIYIIIKMIIVCIVMLICLILAVVFAVSAWMSAALEPKIISAVFLVVMIVVTMMVIMYFFCLLHTVKVCRANALYGDNFSSVSGYAAVLTILAALGSVLGLLSAIVNVEMAGIASFACKIGWMVLAGLWILVYKSKINGNAEGE